MKEKYPVEVAEIKGDFKITDSEVTSRGAKLLAWAARDKIYTNKPLAVVREYIFNALDEHRKLNVDQPVEVHCPTVEDLEFRVRDFGLGLDDHDMRKVFGAIGETKKGESDVGGFGIGAKVGNAYAESFYVESFFGGKRTTYQFFLVSETGSTSPPSVKIAEIGCEEFDGPTGILVRVPVMERDLQVFEESCRRVLFYVEGECSINIDCAYAKYKEINGVKFAYAHDEGGFFFVQGGAVYDVPSDLYDKKYKFLKGVALVLPLNSFNFTISRQEVEADHAARTLINNSIERAMEYGRGLAKKLLDKDIFFVAKLYKRYKNLNKLIFLSDPDSSKMLKVHGSIYSEDLNYSNVYYFGWGYKKRGYERGVRLYNEYSFKIPAIGETVWYIPYDDRGKQRNKIKYLLKEDIAVRVFCLTNEQLEIVSKNPIIKDALKLAFDVEIPKHLVSKKSYSRAKISVELGDVNKAKYYLVSSYGKVTISGSEYKVRDGWPDPIRRFGLQKKVVIVPRSQSKKLEKANLQRFTVNVKEMRRAKKRWKSLNFVDDMKRCPWGSMWAKEKGFSDSIKNYIRDHPYHLEAKKIQKKIQSLNPLWDFAIKGGGASCVYDEIRKEGLTKQVFDL